MAYCTLAEVRGNMPKFTLSATSTPTEAQVTEFVDQISGEIDVYLAAADITIPVTTPAAATNWLKKINAEGATASALRAMFPDATGPGETPAYAFWEKRYQDALKALKTGVMSSLFTTSDDLVNPSTYLTINPEEELTIGTLAEPRFEVDKVY